MDDARTRQGSADRSLARRFTTGTLWSLASILAARGAALATAILAGRLLGSEGFGRLALVQATVEVGAAVFTFGLGVAATRYVAAHRHDAERAGGIIGFVLTGTAVAGAVGAVASWALADAVASWLLAAPDLADELRWAAAAVAFGALFTSATGALAGLEDFRSVAKAAAVRGIAGAVLLVCGLLAAGLGGAVAGWAAGELVAAAAALHLLVRATRTREVPIRLRRSRRHLSIVWRFGLPAMLASLSTVPALWAVRLLLARQPDGYAALGVFTAAQKWSSAVLLLPAAVGNIALPMLASSFGRGEAVGFRRVTRLNVGTGTLVAAVGAAVVALFAGPLMRLFGPGYADGRAALVVLALAAVPTALNTLVGQTLVSADRMWARFGFDAALAITLAVAALWLVPRWRATGLAAAFAVAFTVVALGLGAYVLRRAPRPAEESGETAGG